jgi:hypothetical protein
MDRDLSHHFASRDRLVLGEDLPSASWVGFAFAVMFLLALGLFFFSPPAGDNSSTVTMNDTSGAH